MSNIDTWLAKNRYDPRQMAVRWGVTVPNVRQAAESVYSQFNRRKIPAIRIGWEIRDRLLAENVEPYVHELEYKIWQLERPWLERFMEPFHYWVW